jgi:anaerobic magnesium-protoporphyrin IX monomethyl ester cyclase
LGGQNPSRVLRAPDWLAYCTAVLEAAGIEAKLFDFPAREWGLNEYEELLKTEKPDFIVLDSTTPSIFSDINCAKLAKKIVPDCKVIMVGPHATSRPKETLTNAEGAVDIIARGEYDLIVRDAMLNFGSLKDVLGITYWNDGNIQHNADRPLVENLDDLPYPAWKQLDMMKYFDGTKLHPYIDIFFRSGLPTQMYILSLAAGDART